MNSTSQSLLNRLRRPNQEIAWERFVQIYAPLIFHWVRGQGLSPEDASDISQNVLTRVLRALPEFQYDPNKRFRGWLRTVTRNATIDFLRSRDRQVPQVADSNMSNIAVANNIDLFEEKEYRAFLLQRALKLMKSDFTSEVWQACWLQVVEEQDAATVAKQLDMSRNAAYLAKSRVLKRLREELEGLIE